VGKVVPSTSCYSIEGTKTTNPPTPLPINTKHTKNKLKQMRIIKAFLACRIIQPC
jgi:hypothetical protein